MLPLKVKLLRSLCIAMVLVGLTTAPASGVVGGILASSSDVLTFVETEYDDIGLDYPMSVAVSPNSKHVYVASQQEDGVLVFSRNDTTGALTFVEMQKDDVGGVSGLGGVESVTISPDGKHVYATGYVDDAVAVFSRTTDTGELTYVEMQQDGAGLVDGLDGARGIAVDPDGDHVYVTGYNDDAVAVFSRDTDTGELTFVEMQQNGVGLVNGLDDPWSVTVSPDGKHVYATGHSDDAVVVFSRNDTTGELTFVEVQQDGVGPVDGLDGAVSVSVSPDGNHVYATGVFDHAVAVFSRNDATGELTFVEMQRDGVGGVDGLSGATSVSVSPGGNHVYVTGYGDDAVVVFSRNGTTGALTFVEMQEDGVGGVDGLDDAYSVTVSPDGNYVYATGIRDDAVVAFSRNGTTGALTFADIKMSTNLYSTGNQLDGARSAAVSPDGNHVYVAAREDDALAVFDRDTTSGELTSVQMLNESMLPIDGLTGANSVALSPDGKHVYVASVDDDAVAVFSRTMPAGTLTFAQVITDGSPFVDSLDFATSVAVSPDGKHVYVTAAMDNAVTAFWRHPTTGLLTVVEDYIDGDGGIIDGLAGAYSVVVSPDGYHVYVAGGQDDAVAGFVRNATSGELSFFQVISDTGSVINGLDRARSLAISPDGKQVYVASMDADSLTVYDRNPNTGNLSFVEIHRDGFGGVNGLDGAHAVAVSPDGKHVYAAGSADDALVVFSRDPISGTLTLEQEIRDNLGGVHGLEYPASIAVSPSGSHVYVTGYHDDSVAVFERHLYVYLPLLVRD
jgi:6-phosphogluconolactonase (cycloisomerase 2 family)